MEGQGTSPWLVWTATALALISLGLVVFDGGILQPNIRASQTEAAQRQQDINQATLASRVERVVEQALANAAVDHHDEDVKSMLARFGVTIANWPAAQTTAPRALAPAPSPTRQGGGR